MLPVLLPEWGPKLTSAFIIAGLYVALLIGVAMHTAVATWILLVLLLAQLVCVETEFFCFFANAGYGVRIGLVRGQDLLDSGIGFNLYNGYFVSFALGTRGIRNVTDGVEVLSAILVNIAVIPPLVMIWPLTMSPKSPGKGEPGPPLSTPQPPECSPDGTP